MRAKIKGTFNGAIERSFVNKDGETIRYKKASINVPGELENCVFKVPVELDISTLEQYKEAYFVADFAFESKYQNYTGRIRTVYPTEKALNDADPNVDGLMSATAYPKGR